MSKQPAHVHVWTLERRTSSGQIDRCACLAVCHRDSSGRIDLYSSDGELPGWYRPSARRAEGAEETDSP